MKEFIRLLLKILIPCIMVILGLFVFKEFLSLFLPFVIAWIISLLIVPIVKKINNKLKLKNKFLNKIIILLVIIGVIVLLILSCYRIILFVPELLVCLKDGLNKLDINIKELIPYYNGTINFEAIKGYIEQYSSQIVNISESIIGFASYIPSFLIKLFITIMATYYFVAEEVDFSKALEKVIPEDFWTHYELIKDNAKDMFVKYFISQFKISAVIFAILFIGFLILGIKNSFLIALLTALLDMIPVFGTGAVLWPWAAYCVFIGNYYLAIGLVVVYAVSLIFRQVVQPKLIGDTVGISSIGTLLFMYIGFLIAGIGGMIIAVPIGVFILNLIKAGILDRWINDIKKLINIIYKFLEK